MPMNRTLEARLRARERQVAAGGHSFTVRRPKAAEIIDGLDGLDAVRRFTVGWNLTNADLVPGGNPDPEPFDAALFADYVEDNPELWPPIAEAIVAMWREHEDRKAADAKN